MIQIEIDERTKAVRTFKRRTMRDLAEAFDYLRACYSDDLGPISTRRVNMDFLLVETVPPFRRPAVSYVIPYKARVTFFADGEVR